MAGNVPYGSLTGTSAISNLVQTAYDQYVRMALRSIPVMRALADVKPVQQAMPGSSVVFSIYSDLAQATTTLTETSDVSSIALGNPNQITVTLNEYGSAVTTTKNDIDNVVTEYGIARLKGKTAGQRAKALIDIAHPKFREELLFEARKMNLMV